MQLFGGDYIAYVASVTFYFQRLILRKWPRMEWFLKACDLKGDGLIKIANTGRY